MALDDADVVLIRSCRDPVGARRRQRLSSRCVYSLLVMGRRGSVHSAAIGLQLVTTTSSPPDLFQKVSSSGLLPSTRLALPLGRRIRIFWADVRHKTSIKIGLLRTRFVVSAQCCLTSTGPQERP